MTDHSLLLPVTRSVVYYDATTNELSVTSESFQKLVHVHETWMLPERLELSTFGLQDRYSTN